LVCLYVLGGHLVAECRRFNPGTVTTRPPGHWETVKGRINASKTSLDQIIAFDGMT
jgi:hypothetical protein